jgi:hypothetical protein
VKPNSFCNTFKGAEAPKAFIPRIAPSSPTECAQPHGDAGFNRRGQHAVAVFLALALEDFPGRHAHHTGPDGLGLELLVSRHAEGRLTARSQEQHVRLAALGVGQYIGALEQTGGRGIFRPIEGGERLP